MCLENGLNHFKRKSDSTTIKVEDLNIERLNHSTKKPPLKGGFFEKTKSET